MADDKFDELIQKQIERENKMKQVRKLKPVCWFG